MMAGEELMQESGGGLLQNEFVFDIWSFPEIWYNFCIISKRWAAVVIVGSILMGFLLYQVFRKTRDIQKWAFDILIVRVPIITFIAIYAFAFIYKLLNLM